MNDNKNRNKLEGPISSYNQPLSFEKVWLMFRETDRKFQEMREESNEIDRKIDKLSKINGNVSENSKDVAEEFFIRGLERRSSILGITYDQVGKLEKRTKKVQGE